MGAGELHERLRPGRRVHRRARAHARDDDPLLPVARRGDHPARQRALARLVTARGSGRAVGVRRAGDRCALSGVPPGPEGEPRPGHARGAVHPARHQRDAFRLRARRRGLSHVPGSDHDFDQAGRHGRRDPRQHSTVGPLVEHRASDGHQASIDPFVLHLHDPRGRPLYRQRQGDAGADRRASTQLVESAFAELGEHPLAVHPRRGRRRHRGQRRRLYDRQPELRGFERPAPVNQRHAPTHAARYLLRYRLLGLGRGEHEAGGTRLPDRQRPERGSTRRDALRRQGRRSGRGNPQSRRPGASSRRLQLPNLEPDKPPESGALRARRDPDGQEGRALSHLRSKSLRRHRQRRGEFRSRRVHDDEPVPVLAERREPQREHGQHPLRHELHP